MFDVEFSGVTQTFYVPTANIVEKHSVLRIKIGYQPCADLLLIALLFWLLERYPLILKNLPFYNFEILKSYGNVFFHQRDQFQKNIYFNYVKFTFTQSTAINLLFQKLDFKVQKTI